MNIPVKHFLRYILQTEYRQQQKELKRLHNIPRYTPTITNLLGKRIELGDSASFLFMYKEIFEQQIYRFKTNTQHPTIIDGGANIGLSILYFKKLYPHSHIIAFEPDEEVYEFLKQNINNFELSDIDLINKALWSSETVLEFMSEGADGGRIMQIDPNFTSYSVQTIRLRHYLNRYINFLKLDIEGAETEVLIDCQDLLHNVENLFVEYHSFVNEPQTLSKILNILQEAGFRLHIHPSITSPQPFYRRNINLGMDMQLNIFAFRG